VSALFRFFAYFFFYPVRSGPIGFFRKQLKNPDRRNTFYFLVFVFLAVFVLYIVYREYTLLVEFLALLKAGDYKRMNDWFMIKLTIIEKYIWFQFLGNRQQRTRYRMRVRITFKRYLLDHFRFMKARAARKKILKKFFGRRYFVKSLRKYFRKKYYFKKSFKKRLLKMRQTAIWVPKRITEWHFDRLVTYRGRIKRHCKRVYRWHYVTDFAGFILFVTRILFKYLEFSAFLFWNLLSLLHVYLVIAVACFVKYLILFSLISFKVITVPYVLYTLLTYSGAWFSRQVIMNPQIRDILRRYRRALNWCIFINLFKLFALKICRYDILGPVGFFEELAEILYLAFDGLEFFFICCLFVVGIHFLLIYFALPSGFLYYTDQLVSVFSDQDLLLFLVVILLIFLYIFSKVILPCLMFTRKLIKYSLFTDIPYSRERAFLDEFEIHERMVRRCSVASRNGKRLPLRGCIELFVLLCVGFSLIFLRTFVFFSSIMHLVRRFIRGLIRAKYAREFKFSLTVLDRNVTIVVTIPKFVFLIRRRFSRKLRRNLCYFNAVVYEFALKFFLILRVLAISVFIEFYWLAVSFFATFYYLFIDVCARRTRDARLRLFKNFKIMRAFVFLNTFRLALLFYLGKLLLLMTFFFTSLLWFAYLLSIFFKKILYFFYEQMSFRIARARLYGLPYYDRPWYAIFWCVCIIVKSLILWALLLMFIFIIGIFLFLV
jgi:hypothetical protein